LKRILYISQYYPPEVGAGAVRAEVMAQALSAAGYEIQVLAERPNYPLGQPYPGYKKHSYIKEVYQGVPVTRTWVAMNRRRNLWEQMVFYLSFMVSSLVTVLQSTQRYDLVIATSPPIFGAISGALLSQWFGCPFVLEVRDLWPDSAVKKELYSQDSWFIRLGKQVEALLYRRADHVIAVTDAAETIIQSKSGHRRTSIIWNGVNTELFKKIPSDLWPEDAKKRKGTFRVGYVGSLGHIHDIESFIRAAKAVEHDSDIEFMIVGDGGQQDQLQSLLETIQPQNVNWVGLKPHDEVPSFMSSFDLAANPIHDSEAFRSIITVKFYEYLACEVPVVCLASGVQERLAIASGAAITHPPGDWKSLAADVLRLKNNPNDLKELQSPARAFVERNYSRSSQAAQMVNFVDSLDL